MKEKVKAVHTRSSSSSHAPPPRRNSLSPAKREEESPPIGTNVSYEIDLKDDDDDDEDEEDDDDELSSEPESSSNEEINPKFGSTGSIANVSTLAKSLEKQFENRKAKPFGGVDLFVDDKNKLKESSSSKETVSPFFNFLRIKY